MLLALIGSLLTNYVFGGLRLQTPGQKLTPARNCAEANQAPQPGLTLAKVSDLGDALTALGDLRAGRTPPTC